MSSSNKRSVRIGLIGCGRIAQLVHLNELARLPGMDVTALAEPDPGRLAEAHRRVPRAAGFADYHDLLTQQDVDAVVICLPNQLHAEAACAAFAQGKSVYLEKPVACGLESAAAVLEAWRRAGTTGMTGLNFRYNAQYAAAREAIRSGALGHIITARAVFTSAARQVPAWRQTVAGGGGVLLDLASHLMDGARFLFGSDVRRVSATAQSRHFEQDTASVLAELESGLTVQCHVAMGGVEEHGWEIRGESGSLQFERTTTRTPLFTPAKPVGDRLRRLNGAAELLHPAALLRTRHREESFGLAFAAFADAVREKRQASPDLTDGYLSLANVLAAVESAGTGQWVAPRSGVAVQEDGRQHAHPARP